MKSFAVGILACLALGGTVIAADVPNMVGTWEPTGESAGARFVGVFKRDGKQIIVSTELGAATADVAGDEIEWRWQDNLPTVSVAVCDVMKKAQ